MGWLLAATFAFLAMGNMAVVFGWYVLNKRGSLVPLLGGLAGAGASLTLPFPALSSWWFVPLILDVGCGPLVVLTGLFLVWRRLKEMRGYD